MQKKQFQLRANDARKTWKLINSLLNKNNKPSMSKFLKINNSLTADANEIVKAFNEYFVEIDPKLAEKIPPTKSGSTVSKAIYVKNFMMILPTDPNDPNEIFNIISTLKTHLRVE